jgi:hypothetical protein
VTRLRIVPSKKYYLILNKYVERGKKIFKIKKLKNKRTYPPRN